MEAELPGPGSSQELVGVQELPQVGAGAPSVTFCHTVMLLPEHANPVFHTVSHLEVFAQAFLSPPASKTPHPSRRCSSGAFVVTLPVHCPPPVP